MGSYTELWFRAQLRDDTPSALLEWFENMVSPDQPFIPYDDHPFFQCERWEDVLAGQGSAQYSFADHRRPFLFARAASGFTPRASLVVHTSFKDYDDEAAKFIHWITPHVYATPGTLLGYSLWDQSRDVIPDGDEYRDRPTLYFMPDAQGGSPA